MKAYYLLCIILAATVLLCSCSSRAMQDGASTAVPSIGSDPSEDVYFSQRDLSGSYDPSHCAVIELKGDTAACASDAVRIDGSTVTISDEGSYLLRGNLTDGMILVDAGEDDKTQLILQNVSIHSQSSAPIYIRQADKVFLTLEQGSENSLTSGESYIPIDDNQIDGVIFSKSDLCLNGTGALTISSPAGHGIVSKDELTMAGGGSYTITAAGHGLSVNDSICIEQVKLTVSSGKDAIKAEHDTDSLLGLIYIQDGTYDLTCAGDGISAGAALTIEGGSFRITAGGGSENGEIRVSDQWGHMGGRPDGPGGKGNTPHPTEGTDSLEDSASIKGIKSAGIMRITGGSYLIDSADDALHSNDELIVEGGSFTIESGDDGLHADNALLISGGSLAIKESYEGLEGLSVEISGGTISVVSSDDGINAAGGSDGSGFGGFRGGDRFGGSGSSDSFIRITAGTLSIRAEGDGIDSNGTLEITGGAITVCCPTMGDTAVLDYEISGSVHGGTFIGTGAYQMAQSFSDSGQGVIAVSVGNQPAGTEICLTDEAGNLILSHCPELDFAIVILSSPEIQKGNTYTITVGSANGSFPAS